MEAFEYAIRKDVRNNPIVREIDQARLREQWKLLAVAGFMALFGVFYGWQHYELREHGYRLEEMQRQRASEDDIAQHLHLEIETLKSPARVEALALNDLHLVAPSTDEAIVIERVVPAAPPAKSVVARR
jgi:cell division protein FtsL